jgi:hypothetical protein
LKRLMLFAGVVAMDEEYTVHFAGILPPVIRAPRMPS